MNQKNIYQEKNMAPVTIKDIKVITTQPNYSKLIVVKIITSEPGLYGLGCATFTQRWRAVVAALEGHIIPFMLGRDVSRIEEAFRMMMVNGYWRNGPVLNNAISGIDMALWDLKGKMANMPVYQLLGGKCREAAACYTHADGRTPQQVVDNVRKFMEEGYHYIRIQMGGYGGKAESMYRPEGAPDGAYYDDRAYTRNMLNMMEFVRSKVGDEVELLHDVHERLRPTDAVKFAKDVEQFNLFFLEDLLAPEDIEYFRHVRQVCATPIAMGELFNNPHEWTSMIANRTIDFLRMHISQMGGITPARDAALPGTGRAIFRRWDTRPTCTWMYGLRISASRNGAASPSWFTICSPGCRKCARAICIPTINPAWGSRLMKSLRPNTPARMSWKVGRKPACRMVRRFGHKRLAISTLALSWHTYG
jgi:mannonate dehydratase